MWVRTRDADGKAICFICEEPVLRAGEACSRSCYAHFLVAVTMQSGIVHMDSLLTLEEQGWYSEGHGLDPEAA